MTSNDHIMFVFNAGEWHYSDAWNAKKHQCHDQHYRRWRLLNLENVLFKISWDGSKRKFLGFWWLHQLLQIIARKKYWGSRLPRWDMKTFSLLCERVTHQYLLTGRIDRTKAVSRVNDRMMKPTHTFEESWEFCMLWDGILAVVQSNPFERHQGF